MNVEVDGLVHESITFKCGKVLLGPHMEDLGQLRVPVCLTAYLWGLRDT